MDTVKVRIGNGEVQEVSMDPGVMTVFSAVGYAKPDLDWTRVSVSLLRKGTTSEGFRESVARQVPVEPGDLISVHGVVMAGR